jgi:hypothetical protein
MSEDDFSIFSNLPRRRGERDDDEEQRRRRARAYLNMRNFNQEGPLPPRPHRSAVGGPSINQGVTPPPITSVWSAADAAANGMSISNGGLTVTSNPTGGAWASVRNSISKTAGKLYVEFLTVVPPSDGRIVYGLASAGFNPVDYIGDNPYSGGAYPTTNFASAGFTSNYSARAGIPALGDVLALAVDFGTGNMWLARNNVWVQSSNPATGSLPFMSFALATVGALFAGVSFYASGNVITLQSTPASQKYAPPAGFSPWG